MSLLKQEDIDKLEKLYFKQPKILYQHLFGSMHQLVEEIIPYILTNDINYFYENVEKHNIFMHGFRIENIRLRPATFENENKLLFPDDARKNYLNYFGTIIGDISQVMVKEDLLTGERIVKEIDVKEKDIAIGKKRFTWRM